MFLEIRVNNLLPRVAERLSVGFHPAEFVVLSQFHLTGLVLMNLLKVMSLFIISTPPKAQFCSVITFHKLMFLFLAPPICPRHACSGRSVHIRRAPRTSHIRARCPLYFLQLFSHSFLNDATHFSELSLNMAAGHMLSCDHNR